MYIKWFCTSSVNSQAWEERTIAEIYDVLYLFRDIFYLRESIECFIVMIYF